MGRETKILLGLLGLLAGVFMGVLSMKLFVPRPPAGAGPDIHTEIADTAAAHDLVEPPRLTMRASDFAAAPPLVLAVVTPPDATRFAPAAADPRDRYATGESGFDHAVISAAPAAELAPPRHDPSVTPASFDQAASSPSSFVPVDQPAADGRVDDAHQPFPRDAAVPSGPPPASLAGGHVTQSGDTWWSLAERAYGDGRLYRAVYAWNRARDPRITLAPGTPLQLPPLADLTAAWPHLVPPASRTSPATSVGQ
jgi:5'-nucleotidase/UDP-sugar diphosphatase